VKRSFGSSKLPLIALVGNKSDLSHMRAVKDATAQRFAAENDMLKYNVSAKTGDNIDSSFHQIAAALSGSPLPRAELEAHDRALTAAITKYERHDEEVEGGRVPEYTGKKRNCTVS